MIAEDLGRITPPVYRLRDELGLPGMAVLLWAFRGPARSPHRLENHVRNEVAYTSIHDTDTVAGFFGGEPSPWELIELAYASPASLAIVPAQDVLGLGSEARMNRPGTAEGNWTWRLEPGRLTGSLAARLRALAERTGRTV
jgi:4-alpha-glucanotransferase